MRKSKFPARIRGEREGDKTKRIPPAMNAIGSVKNLEQP